MRAVRPTTNYEMWVDLFILFYFFFSPFHSFLMLLWQPSQARNFSNTNNIEVKRIWMSSSGPV